MLPRSAPYRPTRSPLPGRPERRLNPAVRLGLLLTLLAIAKTALAEDPTAEFLRGLLDRGLYRVAENEAIRRLDDPLLKPHEKVTWSIGLAQAYLRHAHAMNGSDRESLAAKAEQKLADLLRVSPPLPRQPQIRTQQALFTAERAEMLVWDFQQWGGDRQRTAAVDSLQAAATVLRDVRSQLDTDVRAAARRSDQDEADGELTAGEIRRLQRELDVQLARSLTSLVEIVPDGPERTSALREADQRLQTLADGWIGELRTWEARLLRARLARLRGENGQAAGIIRAALEDQPARWLAERFIAEQVRTLLADGKIDLALQTLLDETRSHGQLGDELRAMQVDALLQGRRLAEQKSDTAAADALWLQAEAIATSLSGSWRTSVERKLTQEKEATRYGPEVAALVQSARAAYQSADLDRANALFQQASARAITDGYPLAADEFDYTRGSILVSQQRFADALAVFDKLNERSPFGAYTRDGDLLRAYAIGRLYAAAPSAELQDRYVASLSQHRQRFASSASAAEATWMLAAFEEGRQQWTQALSLYRTLTDDPDHGAAAQLRVAVLYAQILSRLRELGQPVNDWEDRAAEDLAACVRSFPSAPDQLTPGQAEIVLRLVRMVLSHREHLYPQAEQLLVPVLNAGAHQRRTADQLGTEVSGEWTRLTRTAAQLRIVALSGQGRLEEARQLFQDLAIAEPDALLALLQGLSGLTQDIPAEHRQQLAHLQLDTAREIRLQQPQLTDDQRRILDESIADAYLAAGNFPNAIAFYERLLKQSPQDRSHLRTVAELLQTGGETEQLQKAKGYWQRLERLTPKGSPEWFEARLNLATCAARLGQHEDARKLIALTRLVYPDLGGAATKARFEALLPSQ